MTLLNMTKTIMQSVLIGSFIYTVYIAFGATGNLGEAAGIWIASAAIGLASTLHLLDISKIIVSTIQIATGLIAFTTVALMNSWIALTLSELLWYMAGILIIMTVIIGIFIVTNVLEARKINEKLKNPAENE